MDEQQHQSAGASESGGAAGMETAGSGEQWVITFGDNGEIAKIEKLDAESGERQELSEEEYAVAAGWDLSGSSDYAGYYGGGMDDYSGYGGGDPYEEAYYQGLSDGMEAAYASSGMSPEEMAYYQGMQDYMAYCM